MADADVDVKIKADDQGGHEATEHLKEGLDELKEHAEQLGESLKQIGEAFGIAFSIDKIKEFIEGMAELGEQTERTAEIFGITTEQVGLLNFAAQATGGSGEQLMRTLTRMSTALEDVSGKATPTSAAVKALGLSMDDLRGIPLPEVLDKLREKFSDLPEGLARTAIAQNLARNGAESLLPILSMSADKWEELRTQYEATGAALSGPTAAAFADTEHKLSLMSQAFQGLGIRIFEVIRPAVNAAAEAVTGFVESIDAAHVSAALETLVDTLLTVMTKITEIALGAERIIGEIVIRVQAIADYGLKAFDSSHTAKMAQALADMNTGIDAQLKNSEAMFTSWANTLKGIISSAANNTGLGWDEARQKLGGFKPPKESGDGATLNLDGGAGADEATAAAKSQLDGQIAVLQASLQQKQVLLQNDLAAGKLTEAQYTQAVIDATNQQYQAQVALLQKEAAISGLKVSQRQEVLNKIALLEQTNATAILKIQQKAAEDTRKAWEAPITALGNAISSQVGALVSGTETIGQALLNIGTSVATDLISGALKSITAMAAQAFAGVFAHDAPTLGLGAATTAAAASAAVSASAAGLASLDKGTWSLPTDGPIMAHRGETVMPKFESEQFRNMVDTVNSLAGKGAGGGEEHYHFHGALWDKDAVVKALTTHMNRNPSLRPAF